MPAVSNSGKGKVITVSGPAAPSLLGRVMMHEHLHCDSYDADRAEVITEEKPMSAERRKYLMDEAIPPLRKCMEHGCRAFVDVTMAPWRAWPDFYIEASRATGMHIILCTGFYREIELGKYWARTPEDQIWPFVRQSSAETLADFCVREIMEGIHNTPVRAGAIKLGCSRPEMTLTEEKTFRAGARAQKATGVHITTHCTQAGAVTPQLKILDEEGVDLGRVVIGHAAWAMMDPAGLKSILEWMKRGVNFMPTNMGIGSDNGEGWRPLVDAIQKVFDAGHGDKLHMSLDGWFASGPGNSINPDGGFGLVSYLPGPPFLHLFTHTLPALRRFGLTAAQEEMILEKNPQRVLPVQ